MKNLASGALIAVGGISLFAVSVAGFLKISGRLNKQGVGNMPLVKEYIEDEPLEELSGPGISATDASIKQGVAKESPQGNKIDRAKAVAADRLIRQRKKIFRLLEPFDPPEGSALEIPELYQKIKEGYRQLDRARRAHEKKKYDLELLETDLEERRKTIQELMDAVDNARQELESRFTLFHKEIIEVKQQELKNLKLMAGQLAGMDAKKAAEILIRYSGDKEDLAVKLLTTMDSEAASEILGELDPDQGARIIEKATRILKK